MEQEYAFLSYLIPKNIKGTVFANMKGSMQDAADALQWHIYNGLCKNINQEIKILNILPVSSFPQYYKDPFIKEVTFDTAYNTENINIGYCNIKFIREYAKAFSAYRTLKKWLSQSKTPKTLFLYTASHAFLKAIQRLKNDYDFDVCVIIADLPNMKDLSSNKGSLIKLLEKLQSNDTYTLLSCVDYYVLLTKHMATYMKLDKPFSVMEGISTAQHEFSAPVYDSAVKTVFYAGMLHRKFGVLNLLEAFRRIPSPDYRLILCGVGDGEDKIREAASQDSRIDFRGRLPREEVLKLQSQATVLVNPRQNNEEFTKYSFPSKNLEYLSSGIPFIAYKLDGIPDEYNDYILYVQDNEIDTLTRRIMEICEMPAADREQIGVKARAFVSDYKNEVVQTKKILSLIEKAKSGYKSSTTK